MKTATGKPAVRVLWKKENTEQLEKTESAVEQRTADTYHVVEVAIINGDVGVNGSQKRQESPLGYR